MMGLFRKGERGTKSKVITGLVLTLFLIGMLTLAFNIQPVKASGTIYIRADGSIEPSTASITSVDNITYTFTDNNYDSIVVQRDNIVVDGAGYTLQGTGSGCGIDLSSRSNVTVKNIEIKSFYHGIWLDYSLNNAISGNNISNNNYGIRLFSSSNNNAISGNNISNNNYGIWLSSFSNNNAISGNNITANNGYGIWLYYSSYNLVVENTFVNDGLSVCSSYGNVVEGNLVNGKPLVYLEGVSDYAVGEAGQVILVNCITITVENLNLSNTGVGVQLTGTKNTKISSNNITANNRYGIWLDYSSNNVISGNNIANNWHGIRLDYSSNNNVISGNNITANNWHGIELYSSSNNAISGNNITANNGYGIWLFSSSNNNAISGNNITANNGYGIWLSYSSNNAIFHNNFVNNSVQVYTYESVNVWDNGYPSGGNFWSDYTGVDVKSGPNQDQPSSDGIGDTPYVINGTNQDNYPLMGMFSDFPIIYQEKTYDVTTICNSTVSGFQFDHANRTIDFDVTGPDGTVGFCRIMIPRALIESFYTVLVDGEEIPYTELPISNSTHAFLYFMYSHSTRHIRITYAPPPVGGNIVPINKLELLMPYIGVISVILVAITVAVKKRRLYKQF